jgi:hypothetical protein
MNATILPNQYLYDIVIECLQDTVQAGQSISANITITNNGLYEGDVNVVWWIEDAYGTNYTSTSTIANISYGETWSSTKSLPIPSSASAGIYYFKVNLNVGDYSSTVYDTFEVTIPSTPISGPSAGPSIPVKKPEEKPNIEVKYLSTHIVIPSIPKEYDIEIKNSGNLTIHNLTLYLQGLELSWFSIFPSKVDLDVNKTIVFKINYTVPASAEIKKYPISILIKSDELEKSIRITISVIEILEKSEFEKKREALEKEIQEIEEELRRLEERRIPTDALQKLLYNAKERLELAKKEMEIGNLIKASEFLQESRILIDAINETITSIKPFETRNILIIVLIFIVAVVLIFGSKYLRKHPRKKIKKRRKRIKQFLQEEKLQSELAEV